MVNLEVKNWQTLMIVGVVDQKEFVTDLRREEYEAMDTCFLMTINDGKVINLQMLKGLALV